MTKSWELAQVVVTLACVSLMSISAVAMITGNLVPFTIGLLILAVGATASRVLGFSLPTACLVASIGVAIVSRSTLLPAPLEGYTIPLATLLAMPALLARGRIASLRGKGFLYLLLLGIATGLSSLAFGGVMTAITAIGLVLYWGTMLLVGKTLSQTQRFKIGCVVLALGVIEVLVAFAESGLGLTSVHTAVSATPDGVYVARPNQLLGGGFLRAQGSLGYPIPFANFLTVCLGILFVFWEEIARWARVGLLILLPLGVLLSGTRAGLIAVPVVIVAGILLRPRQQALRRRTFAAAIRVPVAFLILVVAGLGVLQFASRTDVLTNFSFVHRFGVLSASPELVFRSPVQTLIGSGLNSHEQYFRSGMLPGDQTFAVDNAYVMVLITSGLFGLIAFVALLLLGLRANGRRMAPVMLGYSVFFFFYDGHLWQITSGLFMMLLGFSIAPRSEVDAVKSDDSSASIPVSGAG